MINFQNFDSLYSVTSYFNNEHTCKQVIAEYGIFIEIIVYL